MDNKKNQVVISIYFLNFYNVLKLICSILTVRNVTYND